MQSLSSMTRHGVTTNQECVSHHATAASTQPTTALAVSALAVEVVVAVDGGFLVYTTTSSSVAFGAAVEVAEDVAAFSLHSKYLTIMITTINDRVHISINSGGSAGYRPGKTLMGCSIYPPNTTFTNTN